MSTQSSQRQNIALVIGVNAAPNSGQAALLHAERSAQRAAELLASPPCGFTLHGGAPLLGAQATTETARKAIVALMRLKKSAAASQPSSPPPAPPVMVVVAGAQVEVRDPQISPDELLRQLLEADPALPQRVTAQSEIAIRMPVPPQAQRRRR